MYIIVILFRWRTVSCGCRGAEIANSYKNIVGKIYHDLIVEEKTEKREDGLIFGNVGV